MKTVELQVNGKPCTVSIEDDTPLLWVLREELQLTGTKFGCGIAMCGACTVMVGNDAIRSCVYPAVAAQGLAITTIEGLSPDRGHRLQRAWIAEQVPQCGYCQSGMIMAAAALLKATPHPGEKQIDEAITNLCRCGTYPRIKRAILSASRMPGE